MVQDGRDAERWMLVVVSVGYRFFFLLFFLGSTVDVDPARREAWVGKSGWTEGEGTVRRAAVDGLSYGGSL